MNRENIIRMARESADQSPREDWNTNAWVFGEETLEYFAELVAAAEREACAQMAGNYAAANAESDNMASAFLHLATAIRARGEK